MYTSFGKANDRFGFESKGEFRCAYKNDRLTVIFCSLVIIVWVVLILINIVSFWAYLGSGNAMMYDIDRIEQLDREAATYKDNLIDSADRLAAGGQDAFLAEAQKGGSGGPSMMDSFSSGFIGMSANSLSTALALIVLVLLIAGFILIMTLLNKGHTYKFKATDESFTITYPEKMKKEDLVLKYDDILGISWETRKFPLVPECYDISIKTRSLGFVEFRVILTKIARANGITETPFNFIREKIGIADPDEKYLINRGIKKFK